VSVAGLVGEEGLWAATDVKATRLASETRRNDGRPIVMTANGLEWAGDCRRHRQFRQQYGWNGWVVTTHAGNVPT